MNNARLLQPPLTYLIIPSNFNRNDYSVKDVFVAEVTGKGLNTLMRIINRLGLWLSLNTLSQAKGLPDGEVEALVA